MSTNLALAEMKSGYPHWLLTHNFGLHCGKIQGLEPGPKKSIAGEKRHICEWRSAKI
jgi:hypothetical protein